MNLIMRDGSVLFAEIEGVLGQQENALADLENLMAEQRFVLASSDIRQLLDNLERIEHVLSKIAQLDKERASFVEKATKDADESPGTDSLAAVGALDSSASTRFLAIQQRVLRSIVRVAQRSEANRYLLTGLTRVTETAIERLLKLQELRGASLSRPVKERNVFDGSASLDVRA